MHGMSPVQGEPQDKLVPYHWALDGGTPQLPHNVAVQVQLVQLVRCAVSYAQVVPSGSESVQQVQI